MKLIKVGAAVLNQTPFAWEQNQANIVEAIRRARADGVSVLCLPEMSITGYGCEDAFFSPGLQEMAFRVLEEVARETTGMVVCVGLPLYHEKALYNAAALLVDGRIAGFGAKRFLAGDGIHYEPRWFKEWPAGERDELDRGEDAHYPLGDVLFDVGNVRIGFEICEDAWVANRPGSDLALRGVDIILNPSASHFAFGKFAVRQRFVIEGSRAFGVAYLYANLLGNEAGRVIYDGGALIASGGELLARGRRFGFVDVEVATAVVDVEANRREQARRGSHRPRHEEEAVVEIPFTWPQRAPVAPPVIAKTWEDGEAVKEEEFGRAVSLGLWDYMRKSRSHGYVVSISGGADSAACAVLVAQAFELAVEEHGVEGALARIPYAARAQGAKDARAITGALLTCAYQATRNSGPVTKQAAEEVSKGIGARFHLLDVDAQVQGYVAMIEGALGRKLTWEQDDVALQNIQARVRSPSVWMLANLANALLISTSNRSEAAVGYATMDGDTSGGLAPIAGIDKTYLRAWLRWMEARVPALSYINKQAPTAELRPSAAEQTDEKDLMPYDVLETIEDSAIRDKRVPLEVLQEVMPRFAQHTPAQLAAWIERFFRLWCRNQWKRERFAPSFHVDDKNLDPRSWCRFPILSGGYERELAEMRAWVATQ
jgi:NAD+ synthase (glutamine-hydrolysing)